MTGAPIDSRPFEQSNYVYKVKLGRVLATDTIGWHYTYRCSTWSDVDRLVGMWAEVRKNTAVRVDTEYLPDRVSRDGKGPEP